LNQRKAVRDPKSAVAKILFFKINQKWLINVIFINVFAFLYEKANSKKICEEISFPSFFRKMLMSAFLLRFKANYLKKMHAFFFVDSNSPSKDLLFPRGPTLEQKPLYLVGAALNKHNYSIFTTWLFIFINCLQIAVGFRHVHFCRSGKKIADKRRTQRKLLTPGTRATTNYKINSYNAVFRIQTQATYFTWG